MGSYGWQHERFWMEADLGDFLSAITLAYRMTHDTSPFLAIARKIFREEDLHYTLDDKAGVHYLVDEEFASTADATISGLGDPKFSVARSVLEQALNIPAGKAPSGKLLIRGVFEAVESIFLVIIGPDKSNRLNKQAVETHFKPILVGRYAGMADAEDKVNRVIELICSWIKAVHPYRHGTADGQNHEAPMSEAILLASTGMAIMRHLIHPESS
tara:strand:- start:129 stop:770 length:642 start_codon:yes stop_codon:yes gene_type:complete